MNETEIEEFESDESQEESASTNVTGDDAPTTPIKNPPPPGN